MQGIADRRKRIVFKSSFTPYIRQVNTELQKIRVAESPPVKPGISVSPGWEKQKNKYSIDHGV
jgi:hypothetical protein